MTRVAVVSALLIRVPHRFRIRGASEPQLPELVYAAVRTTSRCRGKIMCVRQSATYVRTVGGESLIVEIMQRMRASAQQWRPLRVLA